MKGKLVVNPPPETYSPTGWKDGGGFDLLYAGNEHRALMIEMGGGPVPEPQMTKALALAHKHVRCARREDGEQMRELDRETKPLGHRRKVGLKYVTGLP